MCVNAYVGTCAHECAACTCTCVWMHACVTVHACVSVCACIMHVPCICKCMHDCMCVPVCISVCTHVFVHVRAHVCKHLCVLGWQCSAGSDTLLSVGPPPHSPLVWKPGLDTLCLWPAKHLTCQEPLSQTGLSRGRGQGGSLPRLGPEWQGYNRGEELAPPRTHLG